MSFTLKFEYKKYLEIIYRLIKKVNIFVITLAVLALHFFIMSTPDSGFVFDEAAYIPAARDTLHFVAANAEHTPLSKIVIAACIGSFGDWWFSWRISSVIFGTLSVIAVYLIALHFMGKKYALFSAAFIGLDVLFFVNTSIGILDAQALFFGLLGIWLFLRKRYSWSAVTLGVAVLSKEIAGLFVLGLLFYVLLEKLNARGKLKFDVSLPKVRVKSWKYWKQTVIFLVLFSLVVLGGVQIYDTVYKPASETVLQTNVGATVFVNGNGSAVTTSYNTVNVTSHVYITNAIQHLIFAFKYYAGLTPTINPTIANFRPPWAWALPLVNAGNPPVYYEVTVTAGTVVTHTVAYISQISYPITIFIVPTLVLCFWFLLKRRQEKFPSFYIGWILATYGPWLLFGLLVQKMTFNYYFLYTTPILNVGAPWFISKLQLSEHLKSAILLSLLFVVGVYFLYYFPINIFRA